MTSAQVAEKLGVTPRTVRNYAASGLLPLFFPDPMLFRGVDVLKFKRYVFPLIRKGRDRKGEKRWHVKP